MTQEIPYLCPKGGTHKFRRRRVKVTLPFTGGKTVKVWRRICTKCGHPAKKGISG